MAVPSDTNTLLDAAKCFDCYEPGQREYVNTYLLAVAAGGSLDPQVLLEASKCLWCVEPGQLKYIQTLLQHRIANP